MKARWANRPVQYGPDESVLSCKVRSGCSDERKTKLLQYQDFLRLISTHLLLPLLRHDYRFPRMPRHPSSRFSEVTPQLDFGVLEKRSDHVRDQHMVRSTAPTPTWTHFYRNPEAPNPAYQRGTWGIDLKVGLHRCSSIAQC
jgi:hypothetical protein